MELGTTPNLKAPPVRSSMSRTSRSGIHRCAWDRARGIGKTGPSVCVTWLTVSGLRQNKMRDMYIYIYIYMWYIYIIYNIYIYDNIYTDDDDDDNDGDNYCNMWSLSIELKIYPLVTPSPGITMLSDAFGGWALPLVGNIPLVYG